MQHRDKIIIGKIISEINTGTQILGETTLEEFLNNEILKRAVSMTVINIGELTKNISMETRTEHSQIPWKAVAGMRDLAAHKYQTLRMEDIYHTAKEDFPQLKEMLNKIL